MIGVFNSIKEYYHVSSSYVGQFLGLFLVFRFLYMSITLSGTDGAFRALKGAFSTVIFLFVFDHFFPVYLDIVGSYIKVPSEQTFKHEESSLLKSFFTSGVTYAVIFFATLANSINTILIGILSLVLAFCLPFSYMLSSVLSLNFLTDTVTKALFGSLIWLVVNYLMRDFVSPSSFQRVTELDYYWNLLFASALSLLAIGYSTKIKSIIISGLETIEAKSKEFSYESEKNKIKDGLHKGTLGVSAEGLPVKLGLSLNSQRDAIEEYEDEKRAESLKESLNTSLAEYDLEESSPKSFMQLQENTRKEQEQINSMIASGEARSIGEAKSFIENPDLKSAVDKSHQTKDRKMAQTAKDHNLSTLGEVSMLSDLPNTFDALNEVSNSIKKNEDIELSRLISKNTFESIADAKISEDSPLTYRALQESKQINLDRKDIDMSEQIINDEVSSIGEYEIKKNYPKTHKALGNKMNDKDKGKKC